MDDMVLKLNRDGSVDSPPSAPRAVRAVAMGSEGVALLWSHARDDGAIRGYRIYRDGKLIKTISGNATSFVDAKGSEAASYVVRAVDNSGSVGLAGRPGAGKSASAKPGGPLDPAVAARAPRSGAAPALKGVKGTGPGGFALQWEAVDGAVAYGVWDGPNLLGHVKKPEFQGLLKTPGATSALRVDAVRADGSRTPLTSVVGLRMGEQGIEVDKSMAQGGAANPAAGQAQSQAQAQGQQGAQAPAAGSTGPDGDGGATAAAAPSGAASAEEQAAAMQQAQNQTQQAARAAVRPMR